VQEELKGCGADVRWVPVGNIHLTLKFFGNVTDSQVEAIAQAAVPLAAAQAPLSLHITGAGAFPSLKNPRVVWLGLNGDVAPLAALHRQLEAAFAPLGFPPEGRPFAPHLTLGRVKSPQGRERLTACLSQLQEPETAPFQVSEIILYRSNLSPQGATYLPLKVIPLGG
jgi:2'-5' RNA ligase